MNCFSKINTAEEAQFKESTILFKFLDFKGELYVSIEEHGHKREALLDIAYNLGEAQLRRLSSATTGN